MREEVGRETLGVSNVGGAVGAAGVGVVVVGGGGGGEVAVGIAGGVVKIN